MQVLKKIHFCMGLPHTKVGFKKLIHVATIGTLCVEAMKTLE